MPSEPKASRMGVDEYVVADELGISVQTLRKDRVKARRSSRSAALSATTLIAYWKRLTPLK